MIISSQVCHKVLSNPYKLKYHMRVHSDRREFKCSVCGTGFKGRGNLSRHMINFHPAGKGTEEDEKKDSEEHLRKMDQETE